MYINKPIELRLVISTFLRLSAQVCFVHVKTQGVVKYLLFTKTNMKFNGVLQVRNVIQHNTRV